MIVVQYAVEGETDAPVAERLIRFAGGEPNRRLVARGKRRLDPRIPGIRNASAHYSPWVVIRDLDHDASCAASLAAMLSGGYSEFFQLRIAVRAIEAWLLADQVSFCDYFAVAPARVPADPDACDDPKRRIVDICHTSRRKSIKHDMVPRPRSGRAVGPGYAAGLIEFTESAWDPARALHRSESLRRAYERISALIELCRSRTPESTRKH